MDDLEKLNTAKSIRRFFEERLQSDDADLNPVEIAVYAAVVDLCLDIIDPPGKPYMFSFGSSDKVIIDSAVSLKDAVIQLADKYAMNTPLFHTAISACDETNCVDMFNQFATSSRYIVCHVYRIDRFVYTNVQDFWNRGG